MGGLKKWFKEKWVNTEGKKCGDPKTKNKNAPCKPAAKMASLSKGEKASMSRVKKKATKQGKQFAKYKGKAQGT
jgi:hypothetical protein